MTGYVCTTCDRVFHEDELSDAVETTGRHGRSRLPTMFTFSDGSFHFLRKVKTKKQPQTPAPEPKEDSELLLEVIETLAALPTPPVPVEIKIQPLPLIEPDIEEDESQPMSTMQLAFRRMEK